VINPMLVEGQIHGGVLQGIGQAMLERTVYDTDGQFLTGSYMDYCLPRAVDAPPFETVHHPVPAKTNRSASRAAAKPAAPARSPR